MRLGHTERLGNEMTTKYGAVEINGLGEDAQAYHKADRSETVAWTTPGLYVSRLRLVSDPGFPFWDVSYCHGELDGRAVRVQLPFSQLPKRGLSRAIVEAAKRDHVFAKGLGILENISTLN
jgi:hypothetical protein